MAQSEWKWLLWCCTQILREDQSTAQQLIETMVTVKPAEDHISATDKWETVHMTPDAVARISANLNVYRHAAVDAAARHNSFRDVTRFLDVGAGSAISSIKLAKAWLQLTATVLVLKPFVWMQAAL